MPLGSMLKLHSHTSHDEIGPKVPVGSPKYPSEHESHRWPVYPTGHSVHIILSSSICIQAPPFGQPQGKQSSGVPKKEKVNKQPWLW